MDLREFAHDLRSLEAPARNDRQDCEQSIASILQRAGLAAEEAALQAPHIALGLDLFRDQGLWPLYIWVDDRDQSRMPANTLIYEITLASALLEDQNGSYRIAVWEMAQRDHRLKLLLHHAEMPSPFSGDTPLRKLFTTTPPSHDLYQELRWGVPYRFKPDTDTFMNAHGGPPDISAQYRFLRRPHTVGMAHPL